MAPELSPESSSAVVRELILRLVSSQAANQPQQAEEGRRDADIDEGSSHFRSALVALEAIDQVVPTARHEEDLMEAVQGVESLHLANSCIGDEGLIALMKAFKEGSGRGSALRHLDIRNNGITSRGFQEVADSLEAKFLPGLQDLIISKNDLGPEGVGMLSRLLRTGQLRSIRGIGLGFCNMSYLGMVSFADAMQSGNFVSWGVQTLDVSGNEFGVYGALSLMNSLRMGRLPRLTFLNLSNNELGKEGTQALAAVLKSRSLPHLESLLLSCCGLSDGSALVAEALEASPNLQVLDMSGNHVGNHGSVALARAMRTGKLRRLRQLRLSQCYIGAQEVSYIMDAIDAGQIMALRYIDLSHNPFGSDSDKSYYSTDMIGNQGLASLASLIRKGFLANLEHLNLSYASIDDLGLISLAKCMTARKLPKLRTFLFEGNEILSKKAIKAVVQAIESGNLSALQDMQLGKNSRGEDATMALASALTVSQSAQGPVVEKLKHDLLITQMKNPAGDGTTTRDHVKKIMKARSFRGLEPIRLVGVPDLSAEDKLFNKYLQRQYSNRLSPLVDEEGAPNHPQRPSKFYFSLLLLCAWLLAVIVSKRY